MDIKVTEVATKQLDQLDTDVRAKVIRGLREGLPGAIDSDPALSLEELGRDVRVHMLGRQDPVILYRVFDVDHDGQDEVVILLVIERDELAALSSPSYDASTSQRYPPLTAARVGHELLSKVRSVSD
jgi:hypothetical protein